MMNDMEKLILHSFEQNMALMKSAAMLSETARQLMKARDLIQTLQGENECLKLDLAEARAK